MILGIVGTEGELPAMFKRCPTGELNLRCWKRHTEYIVRPVNMESATTVQWLVKYLFYFPLAGTHTNNIERSGLQHTALSKPCVHAFSMYPQCRCVLNYMFLHSESDMI